MGRTLHSKRSIKHFWAHLKKTEEKHLPKPFNRLLPFHFSVEHNAGKNIGFADYLSRNQTAEAATPSDKEKKIVINTIEEIKHALLRNNIAPEGANNSNFANKQFNEVTNKSHTRTDKTTAFCQ